MCGINGFIQFKDQYDKAAMHNIVHKMNEAIVHRGPDEEGLYADNDCALGMRRLSIIDLAGGSQPIWNETHDKLIVFNGEIYNFRRLREELILKGHRFTTSTDTEVVLHGYEEYGVQGILSRLEGMFAFSIYDTEKKTWLLARDRIGEKPLYFSQKNDLLLFASELKSLLKTGLIEKDIDTCALTQFFQLTYIPAPRSILSDVKKLRPGHYLEIMHNGTVQQNCYWSLADSRRVVTTIRTYDDYKRELRKALEQSVEQRMISDVPLGAFLSGGFDSSIIVGLMSRISGQKINTFTAGFSEKAYDESALAAIVAKKNDTNHHLLQLDINDIYQDLTALLGNIDEPFADSSLIAVHAVSKLARQHVKVVLTGDGGDELFAGYNKYLIGYYANKYHKIPRILRKNVIEKAIGLLPAKNGTTKRIRKAIGAFDLENAARYKQLMSLGFKENECRALLPGMTVDPLSFVDEDYAALHNADSQLRAQYVDVRTVLEGDMLPKVDRASMFTSLETRVPMLDTGVVELAFQMPSKFKIQGKQRKIILKDTFSDLLPKELYHAPKHGFSVPVSDWLENELRGQLLRYADADFLAEQGLFSAEYINGMIQQHLNHQQDRFSELWTYFVFQNWYERAISGHS